MRFVIYIILFLTVSFIGAFIYTKYFLDIDDYKENISQYVSEKINYNFSYTGDLVITIDPEASLIINDIVISDQSDNSQIITKIQQLKLNINKESILDGIIDVNNVEIVNMKFYGFNLDESLIRSYLLIKDLNYKQITNDIFTSIKSLTATAIINDNQMYINDINIETLLLRVNGVGNLNIKNKTLDFKLEGYIKTEEEVDSIYKQTYPKELSNNTLPMKINGPVDDINFDVDLTDIIKKQIIDPIKDKIFDELEEKIRGKIKLPF